MILSHAFILYFCYGQQIQNYNDRQIRAHWNFTAVSQRQRQAAAGCMRIQKAFGYLYQQALSVIGIPPLLPGLG